MPNRKSEAFTRIELIVVVIFVPVVVLLIVLAAERANRPAPRLYCLNNLKQIGAAYRIWANDHNDHFPALGSVANGGWKEYLKNTDQGFLGWTNYAILAKELKQFTDVLVCPSDEREPSDDISHFDSNIHLSYFLGVSADENQPRSLLAGDRNLGGGTTPDRGYGFSPKGGNGNDVAIQTSSKAASVCWSLKMHSPGNSDGGGNILFGDGSAQEVTSGSFRANWLSHANPTTNWPAGHIPSSPSIRVLFP
jgi:prepilin-type processing-associated H-X9-DG protein